MEGLFNPTTIVFQLINALILFAALYFLLYKPVRKFLIAREQKVASQLDDAQKAADEAEAMRAHFSADQRDAELKVAGTLSEGQARAKLQQEKMLSDARKEGDEIIRQARREAEHIIEGAHDAVRAQAAELAVEIARAVLGREVNRADNERLIADFLEKVG